MPSAADLALTRMRHQSRFEIKYVVPHGQADAFRAAIAPYMARDHHQTGASYRVSSVYFDDDALSAYWEKVDGVKFRRKVRIRWYGPDPAEHAFLEIKQKLDRTTQKRRTRRRLAELRAVLQGGADAPESDPVLDEARVLVLGKHMTPRILIRYDRDAWAGTLDPGLRVTFDGNCRFRTTDLFARGRPDDRWFLPPDQVVLEVKFNHFVPLWMVSIVRRLGLATQRISKYCQGTVLARFGGHFH